MPNASADRAQLAYIPETTYAVTPVVGNGYNLRMTGESLSFNVTHAEDKEITADAQPNGATIINASTAGDIKVHMQYAEYDRFLSGVLRAAWAAFGTNGVGATFSGSFTAGTMGTVASTITAGAATSGTSLFTTLQPGQWFQLNAPTHANDKKWVRNSTTVAATATVITLDVNTPLVAGATVAGCFVAASRLANGSTLRSFSIEKQFGDVSQFLTQRGQFVSKFSFGLNDGALTEGSFSFMGKDEIANAVTQLPGATAESQTYEIQNAVTGVGNLWEAGAPLLTTDVKSMSIDLDSALRAQGALGKLGPAGYGVGTISAKGKITVYFANIDLYNKFLGDIYTSIIFSTKDIDGNGYVFTFPRVKLSNGKIVAGGKNTDVMAEFDYTAYADRKNATAALRKTVIIDRLGAAVAP